MKQKIGKRQILFFVSEIIIADYFNSQDWTLKLKNINYYGQAAFATKIIFPLCHCQWEIRVHMCAWKIGDNTGYNNRFEMNHDKYMEVSMINEYHTLYLYFDIRSILISVSVLLWCHFECWLNYLMINTQMNWKMMIITLKNKLSQIGQVLWNIWMWGKK